MTQYDYTPSGGYADTLATLDDGRVIAINTQYNTIYTTMGRPQDTLDGIDKAALIADARLNGKFGRRPSAPVSSTPLPPETHGVGWCDKCHSYCYGDCAS